MQGICNKSYKKRRKESNFTICNNLFIRFMHVMWIIYDLTALTVNACPTSNTEFPHTPP